MAINPAWTNADTVALKSKALDLARQARNLQIQLDDLFRVTNDNSILFDDLADDDGGDPPAALGPVPKQAIWDMLGFRGQYNKLLNNEDISGQGLLGGVLGRIVKV